MTVLNYPQLIASFPDNSTGQITPENMRDFVDSVERKYDGWNVVKAGNIEGNKFPDPVGGEITLPANTIWVINGQIPVTDTIVLEDGAAIISLTGSRSKDALILDAGAGAIPLLRTKNADNASFLISGVGLEVSSPTGSLFDFVNTNAVTIQNCLLGGLTFGTWAGGEFTEIINCGVFLINSSALQFTGTFTTMRFERVSNAGFGVFQTVGDVFDLTGATINILAINNCESQVAQASFALFRVAGDATAAVATINNCRLYAGVAGSFLIGVDNKSLTFTFTANSGFMNTLPIGGHIMSGNALVTINGGAGVWNVIDGNDVAYPDNSQFVLRSNGVNKIQGLQYKGTIARSFIVTVSISLTRTGGGTHDFDIGLFINGALYSISGNDVLISRQLASGDTGALSMTAPVTLNPDDYIDLYARCTSSGSVDLIVTSMQQVIR